MARWPCSGGAESTFASNLDAIDRRFRLSSSIPCEVLILADDCNPEWPSLPLVGYKAARAIADHADVVVATHVRNRDSIEKVRIRPRERAVHRQ